MDESEFEPVPGPSQIKSSNLMMKRSAIDNPDDSAAKKFKSSLEKSSTITSQQQQMEKNLLKQLKRERFRQEFLQKERNSIVSNPDPDESGTQDHENDPNDNQRNLDARLGKESAWVYCHFNPGYDNKDYPDCSSKLH